MQPAHFSSLTALPVASGAAPCRLVVPHVAHRLTTAAGAASELAAEAPCAFDFESPGSACAWDFESARSPMLRRSNDASVDSALAAWCCFSDSALAASC